MEWAAFRNTVFFYWVLLRLVWFVIGISFSFFSHYFHPNSNCNILETFTDLDPGKSDKWSLYFPLVPCHLGASQTVSGACQHSWFNLTSSTIDLKGDTVLAPYKNYIKERGKYNYCITIPYQDCHCKHIIITLHCIPISHNESNM